MTLSSIILLLSSWYALKAHCKNVSIPVVLEFNCLHYFSPLITISLFFLLSGEFQGLPQWSLSPLPLSVSLLLSSPKFIPSQTPTLVKPNSLLPFVQLSRLRKKSQNHANFIFITSTQKLNLLHLLCPFTFYYETKISCLALDP